MRKGASLITTNTTHSGIELPSMEVVTVTMITGSAGAIIADEEDEYTASIP
jgi:hypothetical protein